MSSKRARVAVFISGRGTGFANLCRASRDGRLSADIALLITSNSKAGGLSYADEFGVESFVFRMKDYHNEKQAADTLLAKLSDYRIGYLALAGYLKLLPDEIISRYRGRIVNIHPALLPRFGGKGMYGRHVHEAVLTAGEKESGASVHLVDEVYDHGRILEQIKVPVLPGDTPDTLAARVLQAEYELYPRVLEKLIKGEYTTDNG